MTSQENVLKEFLGWTVEADSNRYGVFVIPEIEHAQRHATSVEEVDQLEEESVALLEAAPELYSACKRALEWFRGEEALGYETLVEMLDKATRKVLGARVPEAKDASGTFHHVCADCGKVFPRAELLQPIERFWQRVEAGEVVPSGQCPDCGALCHLERDLVV